MGGTAPYRLLLTGPVEQSRQISQEGEDSFSDLTEGTYGIKVTDSEDRTVEETVTLISNKTKLIIKNLKTTNVSRNDASDGTISIEACGGCPPYEYSIDGSHFQSSGNFAGLSSGSYTVTARDRDGNTVSETVIIGVICFTRDSYVKTDRGPVRVDRLTPNDRIDGQPIELVCSGSIPRGSRLVKVHPHALGQNVPNRILYLTPNHKIYHRGRLIKAEGAANLLNNPKIETVRTREAVEVFNVLLPTYTTMLVNNLKIESLHPSSVVALRHRQGKF
jgi:hypothetical protein